MFGYDEFGVWVLERNRYFGRKGFGKVWERELLGGGMEYGLFFK